MVKKKRKREEFGEITGITVPTANTLAYIAEAATLLSEPSTKRRARQSLTRDPQYDKNNNIVGGSTFRAENQHEGLPTALAEAYANGASDFVNVKPRRTSFKSSGDPWDVSTSKAYDAGFTLGSAYSPLTSADAIRATTGRTILSSPEFRSDSTRLAVAGFHPSPISKSVSESTFAHQKIFEAQAAVLKSRANGTLDNEAANLTISAIHLYSLAPGEYANKAAFNPTSKTKFNPITGMALPMIQTHMTIAERN